MANRETALFPEPRTRPVVLLVEDEVLIRLALAQALRASGLAVIEARDADEALTVIHAGIVPDALLTDVRMPGGMDGLKLAALLESMFPGMPVFINSAYLDPADLRMEVTLMRKPLDPEVVARTVSAALAARKATE